MRVFQHQIIEDDMSEKIKAKVLDDGRKLYLLRLAGLKALPTHPHWDELELLVKDGLVVVSTDGAVLTDTGRQALGLL
jgi:hypothetical protein